MRIIPITLPTPFYIGPVNVYLIKEDPVTLIDTGPKTKETVDVLRAGMRQAGILISDIRRIVLTHAHEDHCGLARALRDEANEAQVFAHGRRRRLCAEAHHAESDPLGGSHRSLSSFQVASRVSGKLGPRAEPGADARVWRTW